MSENQSNTQIVGGDKSKGAAYIAKHPEEYGFTWGFGPIGKGTGPNYVELRADCPWIDVKPEQVDLFIRTFGPALVSKALGGTSIKVSCDRVNRDSLEKNTSITNDALREKIVSSILLGVIVRSGGGVQTKYVVGGVTYTSEAEAKKASENGERIKALESAQAFLAMAAENGIDPVMARSMAKQQWPLAFALVGVSGKEAMTVEMIPGVDVPQDTSSHFDGTNESDQK